ncbi:nuclear transport factor 2 family protein [Shewanella sp. JM162201]|uniref:Nuclear transport factor 2 family protein n=1 Tax=Shewanella jiangmenensis TaxID=2837387 RepID=A0ABS5V3T1_9GAMM|nr:nuclear transport factor 2 family protein [Shewanella jiangmenensis]MBT1444476.1 nuclear transport factor 2 family protein [Shewanella jiangmenensis]
MPKEQQMAVDYINALTSHDYQTLETFYNRDSVFQDRTAGRKYKGGRFIIEFFERAHEGVLEYQFNIEHMYNSGSLVVMIGNYRLKGPGEQFGKPGKIIEVAVPAVTTLKLDMRNHRVTEHIDLVDYQTLSDQLSMQ